jgi:hypothetical protein
MWLKNLMQRTGTDKQATTADIVLICDFFLRMGWKMSTLLEGALRGKETVKYRM